MPPYGFKLLRLLGAALFSWSALKFYREIAVPGSAFVWFGLAAACVAAYVVVYFWERHEVDELVGLYVPVKKLEKMDGPLARWLGIVPYHPFYAPRPEDEQIRARLRSAGGV